MVDTRCKKRDEMRRTNRFLSDRQNEDLKRLSKKEDLSVAELIRRAIDQFLERKKKGSLKNWSLIYISEGKDFDESKTTTIRQNGKYCSETKTRSFADNPLRETRMQISSLTKSAVLFETKLMLHRPRFQLSTKPAKPGSKRRRLLRASMAVSER